MEAGETLGLEKRETSFSLFVVSKDNLPKDLPLQSASIYFTYILKDILQKSGSKLFLKWPNDFYIKNRKIGGAITSTNKELLFCGIGLNLIEVDDSFGKLDISIDIDEILNLYFIEIEKKNSVEANFFSLFKIEFMHSKIFKQLLMVLKFHLKMLF